MWVCAIEDYAKALKIVNPKREQAAKAQALVASLNAALKLQEDTLAGLVKKLDDLIFLKESKERESNQLKADLADLQAKIDRGEKLVSGLADEKERWIKSLEDLDINFTNLVGDCLLASAFMSYCGPFPSDFRKILNR